MSLKKQNFVILVAGACLLIIDQLLKLQSLYSWYQPWSLTSFFGWEPFLNPGIAFSIPMPYWLTLILSAPIIILLIYFLVRHLSSPLDKDNLKVTNVLVTLSLTLILAGALSNSFDRLFRHQTVDYIRIFTGIINLADVFIVSGAICYLIQKKLNFKLQS